MPLIPQQVFGREGPLVLEIGHGDGRFTAQIAQSNPHWNILGVEAALASVGRAFKRMRREGVHNVRLYYGQAGFVLRNLVPQQGLWRVYVNFPDPWPKAKHQDHRLLQRSFFERLATRLQLGGQLLLTTDHQEYFEFACAQALESGAYEVHTPQPPAHHLQTKYALKWKQQGRSFYHAVFTLTQPSLLPWTPLERFDMPHALLSGEVPPITHFEKQVVPFEHGHAVLLEALQTLDGKGYLIMAHLEDPELTQQVLFEIRPSTHGVYVGLANFGVPLPSGAAKAAVDWLVQWLGAKGLQVVQRSY